MATNRFKQTSAPVATGSKTKRQPAIVNGLNMSAFYLFKNIYFIFYLAFLGIVYIANSHYAVQTIKEIKVLQKELHSVRYESNSKRSDLMYQSMESVVATKVKKLGLQPIANKPKKIISKHAE